MTINLTREGMLEELRNGNAVIRVEDNDEADDMRYFVEFEYSFSNPIFYTGTEPFLYKGRTGLGFYDKITIDPLYNISFKEFIELPGYREPIIELSKEIVGTKAKFIEDLKNGEAELEVFGIDNKIIIANILRINPRKLGPHLYIPEGKERLDYRLEPSNKPIVLDARRFLELD